MLKPFFTYYGGKYRAAPHYPKPRYSTIIEPFAGSAGYSLRYPNLSVKLYDKSPLIAGLWKYLINVSVDEILGLPLIFESTDNLQIAQEAKWLIGFWLNKGTVSPCKTPSAWMREGLRPKSFWGTEIRQRIAEQVGQIRHWQVTESDYEDIPNWEATWFIDPPYQNPVGKHYPVKFTGYPKLGEWCRERNGQAIVCEQEGATWLPFQPFRTIKANESKSGKGISKEVIWSTMGA